MSLTLSRPLPAELTNFESPVVRRTRWACLVIMFLCFPLVAWLGAKESSFAELEQAIYEGRVTEVTTFAMFEDSALTVVWQEGGIRHFTFGYELKHSVYPLPSKHPTTVVDYLRQHYPDVSISPGDPVPHSASVGSWYVPIWVLGLLVLPWVGSMFVLNRMLYTWRGTRMAWVWLILIMPFGSLLFLALSGPTPGIPHPRKPHARIGGFLGFFLAILLVPLLKSLYS